MITDRTSFAKSNCSISIQAWCKMEGIKEFIENLNGQSGSQLTLKCIAETFCMSESVISKSFRFRYMTSVRQYIVYIRMEKAKCLLKNEQLSIGEIADKLGYSVYSNFSRDFKKHTGVLPQNFRKKIVFE